MYLYLINQKEKYSDYYIKGSKLYVNEIAYKGCNLEKDQYETPTTNSVLFSTKAS